MGPLPIVLEVAVPVFSLKQAGFGSSQMLIIRLKVLPIPICDDNKLLSEPGMSNNALWLRIG